MDIFIEEYVEIEWIFPIKYYCANLLERRIHTEILKSDEIIKLQLVHFSTKKIAKIGQPSKTGLAPVPSYLITTILLIIPILLLVICYLY